MSHEVAEGAEWLLPIGPERASLWLARRALVVCFLLAIACGPVLWLTMDGIKTTSSIPLPQATWAGFRDGSLLKQFERYLKELSPITYQLRGIYNELRFELGLLHVPRIVQGRDGWMFLKETVEGPKAAIDHVRPLRRADFAAVRKLAETAGMRLLVLVAPDKSTIYPELLLPGQLDEPRRDLYREIQDSLAAAGCDTIDLKALLLEHKRTHPDELLFYERDSHWRGKACDLTAAAVRAELDRRGWFTPGDTKLQLEEHRWQAIATPDMVMMLGMRTVGYDFLESPWTSVRSLQTHKDQIRADVVTPDGKRAPLRYEQPDAKIALCGTSYSSGYLQIHLAVALGVPLDTRGAIAGSGTFGGMNALLAAVASRKLHPNVLIWEFVERDYLWGWSIPPALAQLLQMVRKG